MKTTAENALSLDELAHRHFDGGATSGDRLELERRLLADPEAADRFAELCLLELALERTVGEQRKRQGVIHELSVHELASARRERVRRVVFRAATAAAAVLVVGVVVKLLWRHAEEEIADTGGKIAPAVVTGSGLAAVQPTSKAERGAIPPVLANYFLPSLHIPAGATLGDALTQLKEALQKLNRTHLSVISNLVFTADPEAATRAIPGLNIRGVSALAVMRLLAAQADCSLDPEAKSIAFKPLKNLPAETETDKPQRLEVSRAFLAAAEIPNVSNALPMYFNSLGSNFIPNASWSEGHSDGDRPKIEVIREFPYPSEFDPPQIPQTWGSEGYFYHGEPLSWYPVTPRQRTEGDFRQVLANWGIEVASFGEIEYPPPSHLASDAGIVIESYEANVDRNGVVTFSGEVDVSASFMNTPTNWSWYRAQSSNDYGSVASGASNAVISFTPTPRGRRVLTAAQQAAERSAPQQSVVQSFKILSAPKVVLGKPLILAETEQVFSAKQFQEWLEASLNSGTEVLSAPTVVSNADGRPANVSVGGISITSSASLEGALVRLDGKYQISPPPALDDFLDGTRLEPAKPVEQEFTIYLHPGQTAVLSVSGGLTAEARDYHVCVQADFARGE